jgi:general secretion pathway protein D
MSDLLIPPDNYVQPPKYIPIKNLLPVDGPIDKRFYGKATVCLSEGAPLSGVLLEVAKQLGISLIVSSKVISSVDFTACDKAFVEIIEDICDIGNLRYTIKGTTVRIEPDAPHLRIYSLQFLSMSRHGSNAVSTTTDVFAKSSETSSLNGSNSAIQGESTVDFWQELELTLSSIIGKKGSMSLHKQGGLISVLATARQHKIIASYINALRATATAQVLIEAKVLEVTLSDRFRSGIDWHSGMSGAIFGMPTGASVQNSSANVTTGDADLYTLGYASKNISGIIKFIEGFGSIRTLSNPRITVMNNQTAVLKVAKNEVFFKIEFDRYQATQAGGQDRINVSSKMQTVPIGIIVTVQAAANLETGEVTLRFNPTVSRVTNFRRDPAVSILASNISGDKTSNSAKSSLSNSIYSEIPVVEVREMDSILKVRSGQGVVMGGLMQESASRKNFGPPGTANMPVIGDISRGRSRDSEVTELVIFLRAHIIPQDGIGPDKSDRRLLNSFSNDPRPLL